MSFILANFIVLGFITKLRVLMASMPKIATYDKDGQTKTLIVASSSSTVTGNFVWPRICNGFLLAPVTLNLTLANFGLGFILLKRSSEITDIPAPVSKSHLSSVSCVYTRMVGLPSR